MGKYGSKKKIYGGRLYHSKKEGSWASYLDKLKESGEITDWQPQVKFDLVVNGKKVCGIIPDFLVTYADGTQEIQEVKAPITQTPVWVVKWKLMQILYPDYSYRVIC